MTTVVGTTEVVETVAVVVLVTSLTVVDWPMYVFVIVWVAEIVAVAVEVRVVGLTTVETRVEMLDTT